MYSMRFPMVYFELSLRFLLIQPPSPKPESFIRRGQKVDPAKGMESRSIMIYFLKLHYSQD
jgi:hypothetical protein